MLLSPSSRRSRNVNVFRALFVGLLFLGWAASGRSYSLIVPNATLADGNTTMQLALGTPPQRLLDGLTAWDDVADLALAEWNVVTQRSRFVSVHNSTAPQAAGNRINNVFFSSTVYGEAWGTRVLAVTGGFRVGSTRVEADVLVNTVYTWNSYRGVLRFGVNDLKRVLLHEFGHVLGLTHPDENGQFITAIMNSTASDTETLQPDDIAGVKFLYDLPTPPVITVQPLSQPVGFGATATLSVTVTGSAPLQYQWRFAGTAVPGATASTLSLTNAQSNNAGAYTVAISNPYGSVVSAPATVSVVTPSRISNVSVRTNLANAQVLTMGFVTSGSKNLVVRSVGPALGSVFGLVGFYPDPKLTLYNGQGTVLDQNDNWNANLAATFSSLGAFPLPANSQDSALFGTLNGPNTVQSSGIGTGVVLVEVYDADAGGGSSRITNVSARNRVGTGGDVLISGFVVAGLAPRKVMIRGIGPGLGDVFGLTGFLADPVIELHRTVGGVDSVVATNDDWSSIYTTTFDAVGAYRLKVGSFDSVLVLSLDPGAYTVQLSGRSGGTGDGVIEVYEAP